jgi:hypothetical protein
MKLPVSLVSLSALFASTLALAAGQIQYFAPGNNISPDGKYALAAVLDDAANETRNYRLVTIQGSSAEIASDAIFQAYADRPDIRGYGPSTTSWSMRHDENDERVYGELVGFQYQYRKTSEIVFAQRKLVDGKAFFAKTSFDAAKYQEQGRAQIVAAALKAGFREEDVHQDFGNQDFVYFNDGKVSNDEWPLSFDLEDGRLVQVAASFYIANFDAPDSDSKAINGEYSIVVKVSLDATGALKEEVVSSTASVGSPGAVSTK